MPTSDVDGTFANRSELPPLTLEDVRAGCREAMVLALKREAILDRLEVELARVGQRVPPELYRELLVAGIIDQHGRKRPREQWRV